MIPLLVFGPSIFFFVFRLDLDFKKKFEVKYRKSAGESLNCYISSITTKQKLEDHVQWKNYTACSYFD